MKVPVRACLRGAALVLTFTVSASLGAMVPAHAEDRSGADAGARWLAGELEDGLLPGPFAGYDGGLTLDAGQALVTIGGQDAAVAAIRDAMSDEASFYTTYGEEGEVDADRTAKLLDFLLSAGDDGRSVGPDPAIDLVAQLEGRVATEAPITGRIQDRTVYGDTANVIGQAFAASALDRAGSALVDEATSFLLRQQCPDGGFRLDFAAADAAEQSCATSEQSHPDVTALVTILLDRVTDEPGVAAARSRAAAWLVARQGPDGSLGGGPSTEAANTNSTGLAAWALRLTGDDAPAGRAAGWVRRQQASDPDPCTTGLTPETGAIAYDPDAFAAARDDAIRPTGRDQWRRASAQALPALLAAPGGSPALLAPDGFVRAGSTVTLRPRLGDGARGCLSGPATAQAVLGASDPVQVDLPSGTGRHTFTLATTAGPSTATVSALGRTTFAVKAPRRVARGERYRLVVRGTVRGERVRVRHAGGTKKVRAGARRVTVRLVAPRRLGRSSVRVTGQFRTRRGATTLRVVR